MNDHQYRPEIDGLRAVAVLSVVLFHAFPDTLSGGFVGVDIFFVISGFLICSIIARSVSAGSFSLLDFYERRARRILPALVAVMVVVLGASYVVLLPDAFAELGKSAVAASLFVANFFFWTSEGDYFGGSAEYAPLLHTWSLGVEEQFYIVAPLVLYATIRWKGKPAAFWTVLALSCVSLCISVAFSRDDAATSFYLPLTRVHELGIGALIALAPNTPALNRGVREALGLTGLTMMGLAIFLYDSSTIFPGAAALLPCTGAGLVIFAARQDTLSGRLLSLRPVVFVGLLSYSLYLWHWPLLVLARHYTASLHLEPSVTFICIAASFVLAFLSLKYIETPFRVRSLAPNRRAMLMLSASAICAVVIAGTTIAVRDGMPDRLSPEIRHIADVEALREMPENVICTQRDGFTNCENAVVVSGTRSEVIFVGDSHVRAIGPTVLDALAARNIAATSLWKEGCPPLPGVYRTSVGSTDRECPRLTEQLLSTLDANPEIRIVAVHARWALYGAGERLSGEPGGSVFLTKAGSELNFERGKNFAILQSKMASLVDEVTRRGRHLIVVGSVPEVGWDVPKVLASNRRFGLTLPAPQDAGFFGAEDRGRTDAWIENMLADRPDATFFPVVPIFCAPTCQIWDGETPYYSDSNHLSWRGAQIFSEPAAKEIEALLQ